MHFSQWGAKNSCLSLKQRNNSLSLCVFFTYISNGQQRQRNSFLSASETCHQGAFIKAWRQPASVTILVAMCPSTLCVLVTVQEGVNCSSTLRLILFFHPWVHMLNVILAVVHICLRHFTHYISSGTTCVFVVSQPP